MINKDELFQKLYEVYGDLDNDMGCYRGDAWLSIKNIVDIINECDDWDEWY